ncbi:MAG TPA: hypothetical protein ENI70_01795 [Candidatus Peregrinibacteria bacterium]|nr:hypothetical protein [Candidatus Peregrinibacteria bacterium]
MFLFKKQKKLIVLAVSFVVILSLFASGILYNLTEKNKILRYSYLASINLSSLSYQEALGTLNQKIEALKKEGVVLKGVGKTYRLSFHKLGITFEPELTLDQVFLNGHQKNLLTNLQDSFFSLVARKSFEPIFTINRPQAFRYLARKLGVHSLREAGVFINADNEYQLMTSRAGESVDLEKIVNEIEANLKELRTPVISFRKTRTEPTIETAEAQLALQKANQLFDKKEIVFTAEKEEEESSWTYYFEQKDQIKFVAEDGSLKINTNPESLSAFLSEGVASAFDEDLSYAIIQRFPAEGERYAEVEKQARDGYEILVKESVAKINQVIGDQEIPPEESLELTLETEFTPSIVIDNTGEKPRALKLIGTGKSNFYTSPEGRDFNIRKGIDLYNNIVIPPGQNLSVNGVLGRITHAAGWKNSLAIFGGGASLDPVPGGGLCQVATTIYRAVLAAGLPVLERRPHSLYVHYYAKYGEGLDATIYPPHPDLLFQNDTPGNIIIQSYAKGHDAYVKFYGTNDGREAIFNGPYRYHEISEEKFMHAAAGDKLEIPKLYNTIYWFYTIIRPDGTKAERLITSTYNKNPIPYSSERD